MPITAQVSVYPLRQPHFSPAIERTLEVLRSHELAVDPGTMSTLVSGEDDAVFAALKEAFQEVAQQGEVVMVVTLSNACPLR